jgi:ribosomal protein S18 acetylase RimI-like enzyme
MGYRSTKYSTILLFHDKVGYAMKLTILRMNEIDIKAHANLIYKSRQNSPLRNDDRTIDSIKKILEQLIEQGEAHVMIIALDEDSGDLLGQLLMWLEWGELGVVRPWQPIIHPEVDQDTVAKALIEHSKKLIETHSKTKLEIWMEITNEQAEKIQPIYERWYQQCGFVLNSKEYFMDTQFSNLRDLEYSIPEDIEIASMSEIPNDELQDIVYETFRTSSDKWVMSMTQAQLKSSVESWLKRDETFNVDASIVFIDEGTIIGYNVMRLEDGSIEVGPIGVLPAHRGRGLGHALLLESINRISSNNQQTVWLTVSTGNTPAYKLYSNLGFINRYEILIYSWVP